MSGRRPSGDIWSQPANSGQSNLAKLVVPARAEPADPAEVEQVQREIEELQRPYHSFIDARTLDKILY